MNVPGLDASWILAHRALHTLGAIRPWTLEQCQNALGEGAPVLVVATTALGDTILCTPLIETLSTRLGRERTFFWVRQPYRSLYVDDPRLGSVFGAQGKYRGLGKARREMRLAMRLDGARDMACPTSGAPGRPPGFIALIANCSEPDVVPWLWWCGARGFLRYRSRWSTWAPWFANRADMRMPHEKGYATGHAIANNLAMATSLGLEPTTERMRIDVWPRGTSPRSGTSHVPGTPNVPASPHHPSPLVLIHPGASRAEKCWPVERWAEVAQGIVQRALASGAPAPRFIVTGSGAERETAEKLRAMLPGNAVSRAGELGLRDLAVLQQGAALFLSGDTGPYHLAVAVGCPTVSLFAPRDRGSSTEACGLHKADRARHAEIETREFGRPISEISAEVVLAEALRVMAALRITA